MTIHTELNTITSSMNELSARITVLVEKTGPPCPATCTPS